MTYFAEEVSYDDVLPLWEEYLWPGRESRIGPMSSMLYYGGYNLDIYGIYEPTFFGIYDNEELVGVNSGHRTDYNAYRSRGLYVNPSFRGLGIGKRLLLATCNKAREEQCNFAWSMPRKGSEFAYTSVGFELTSDWFNEGVEFGPNAYCIMYL